MPRRVPTPPRAHRDASSRSSGATCLTDGLAGGWQYVAIPQRLDRVAHPERSLRIGRVEVGNYVDPSRESATRAATSLLMTGLPRGHR